MAASSWHNRIVDTGEESPDQLLANPRNFRIHPKHQQDALEGVLNEVGWVDDVIVNRTTGHIIDGHLRVSLALKRNELVPVKYVELTEAEEALVLATFDPISALAGQDDALLRDLMVDVQTDNEAILQMLNDLLGDDPTLTEGLTDPDDVPEPPADPITKPGDLWRLGRHRLLCGDSTVVTDVDRLMNGEKADMVFTDPPYNAAFNGRSGRHQVIRNDDLPADQFDQFLSESISAIYLAAPNAPKYVCTDWKMYPSLYRKMQKPTACIVWVKNMWGMGNGYRHQHEFIVFEGQLEASDQSDVWDIKRDNGSDYQHPTQKPTALAERAINNSSQSGDTVLDLFGGSGSTLIACEQTDRNCRMMELDPIYCDVIVNRWQNFTGMTAELAT